MENRTMPRERGPTRRPSPARRLIAELMHHARKVPSLPDARLGRVGELALARRALASPPSWLAIFLRAYGLVARELPPLRQAWLPFPYARLYEHPQTECAVMVEREWRGERVVLAAKLRSPETMTLGEINGHLARFRDAPLESVTSFRQLLRLGGLPWPLRRFFVWRLLNLSGFKRATRLGTAVVSSVGQFGAEQLHPLTTLTSYFSFGPIGPDGAVRLLLVYDHRVLDARTSARALQRVEEVLNTTLLAELRGLREPRQAAA
jgi:hypothetical protein